MAYGESPRDACAAVNRLLGEDGTQDTQSEPPGNRNAARNGTATANAPAPDTSRQTSSRGDAGERPFVFTDWASL